MFAVIFKAHIKTLDDEYFETARRLQDLAIAQFNCREFISMTQGDEEIAISYWDSLSDIDAWKQNSQHLFAQKQGRSVWYQRYKVQVVEILREYEK